MNKSAHTLKEKSDEKDPLKQVLADTEVVDAHLSVDTKASNARRSNRLVASTVSTPIPGATTVAVASTQQQQPQLTLVTTRATRSTAAEVDTPPQSQSESPEKESPVKITRSKRRAIHSAYQPTETERAKTNESSNVISEGDQS